MLFIMKIILAGDGSVGKTVLRNNYLGKSFNSKYDMTIGADFVLHHANVDEYAVKFQIWDLAGQQRFKDVRSRYYLGSAGALLLFDVTQQSSFENLDFWVEEIWEHNGKGVIPIVVLGNKVDLRDQIPDCISIEQAQDFCTTLSEKTRSHGFDIQYLETSAKTGLHVNDAFKAIARVRFQFLEEMKKKKKEKSA